MFREDKKPIIVVANDVSRVQGATDSRQSRETHETQMNGYWIKFDRMEMAPKLKQDKTKLPKNPMNILRYGSRFGVCMLFVCWLLICLLACLVGWLVG